MQENKEDPIEVAIELGNLPQGSCRLDESCFAGYAFFDDLDRRIRKIYEPVEGRLGVYNLRKEIPIIPH